MNRHLRAVLIFLSFLSLSLAAKPTSFCKCTCFTNSTIIPLLGPNTPAPPTAPPPNPGLPLTLRADADDPPKTPTLHPKTCADCNKSFCLSYNLPICADAKEEDVAATCFQRDSYKDQAVVYGFILATGGLLGWALLKPVWERWKIAKEGAGAASGGGRGGYAAVGGR
ncbi:uncharacterized protein MYCGRDRAFT_56988 [Zymoseptoria tritici IPO323]|uniref:MFS transporter n=1 Tax=Zymoseptoria tritici (strain CBS 115943 / IPO323) TaxID=336722 RepID=F9X793_ZYMTI|nr:uncharacterized protein MYCGRDRAFT_56988 [Zymoseptoria tritici IPO323]EGP88913.1 hypothetical protein MYCGRDRAFT_56988 [Zymoseptoria tritici IPO323]